MKGMADLNYEQALDYIHSHKRFGSKLGLERIGELMRLLGNPQEKLRFVHVAGTNGKGSTSIMTAAILRAAGYRTGLTVSPFVVDFCERVQIDGSVISHEELSEEITRIQPFADQVEGLTEFELITAAAFDLFHRKNCEIAVAEVGLGGRFDATNMIPKPLVSVITPIGLDHTQILGDTIEQIAFEKCGIIKPGVPVVTSPAQDIDALPVLLEQCAYRGSTLSQPTLNAAEQVRLSLNGTDFVYQGFSMHVPLLGQYQIANALTAMKAAELAVQQCTNQPLSMQAVQEGLAFVRFPARMEIVCRHPLTILDGAHNPQGAKALAESLSLLGKRPITAVMGMLADKNSTDALKLLAPHFRRLICVTPDNPRALDGHELAARADKLGLPASAAHSIEEAWELASAVAASEQGAVVICGSLYLAGQMRNVILNAD